MEAAHSGGGFHQAITIYWVKGKNSINVRQRGVMFLVWKKLGSIVFIYDNEVIYQTFNNDSITAFSHPYLRAVYYYGKGLLKERFNVK